MGTLEPTSPLPPDLPPAGRPFNPVEAAVGVITRPVPAMQEIAAARPWLIALLLSVVIGLISGLASGMSGFNPANLGNLSDMDPQSRQIAEGVMRMIGPALGIGNAIFAPIVLAIWAGIIYLIARLLGGTGEYSALFSTLAFASIPSLLEAPLIAVLNLAGGALFLLLVPIGLAFFIWNVVLTVLGIRESMRLSTERSLVTCVVPPLGCGLLLCVVIVGIVGLAALGSTAGAATP